jgi:hypothetical protein
LRLFNPNEATTVARIAAKDAFSAVSAVTLDARDDARIKPELSAGRVELSLPAKTIASLIVS